MPSDTSPSYWREYSNLQRIKHDLIRHYLGGWFPKLGSWSGRIVYFDTHAGRGKHLLGQLGSPLVALTTLLKHSYRDRLLSRSQIAFFFIEHDEENLAELKKEIEALGPLPPSVAVHPVCEDCFGVLRDLVASLQQEKLRLAPAFIFVDPYGF